MLNAAALVGAADSVVQVTKSVPSPRASATHPAAHLVHTPAITPFSLTDPASVTAIATVVLAVGAIVTAVFAILAFHKQSAEVTMLQQDRQREAGERRRAQAAQVFTWVGERPVHAGDPPQAAAFVRNTSRQPVYNISMGWGATGQQRWPVLLPDGEHVFPGAGSSVADGTVPIWIEFRDAAGVRWRSTSRGELTDVPEPE